MNNNNPHIKTLQQPGPKLVVNEPEKLIHIPAPAVLGPPPPPLPVPEKLPSVNILVHQQEIPVTALPPHRAGRARPETAALIAALQAMCEADGIQCLISPSEFQVSAVTAVSPSL